MGQIVLEGIKGPQCKFPSRYYRTPLAKLDEVGVPKVERNDGKHGIRLKCNLN